MLGSPITYVPVDFESALRECPHTAERLKTLTRIIGNGGYGGITNELETLLGGEPKTVRWALEHRPGIQELKAG